MTVVHIRFLWIRIRIRFGFDAESRGQEIHLGVLDKGKEVRRSVACALGVGAPMGRVGDPPVPWEGVSEKGILRWGYVEKNRKECPPTSAIM